MPKPKYSKVYSVIRENTNMAELIHADNFEVVAPGHVKFIALSSDNWDFEEIGVAYRDEVKEVILKEDKDQKEVE